MSDSQNSQRLPDTLTPPTSLDKSPSYSEAAEENIWGILLAKRPFLTRIDLTNQQYILGRKETCEICINGTRMEPGFLRVISKEHFLISRDSTLVPYIKDLSKNGTYLNGELLGKDNTSTLCNGDIISVGLKKLEVFEFKDVYSSYDTNIIDGKYVVTKFLGSGAFGEVFLGFSKNTRQRFAVKKIKLNPLYDQKVHTEIEILQSLKNPCIVHLEEVIYETSHVYIVLEYMRGGELLSKILEKKRLSEYLAKLYMYQIVLAVSYLHKEGIIHRDLKPENILLASKNDVTLIKVADFGLSKILSETSVMRTVCGTLTYVAPEVLQDEHTYTKMVDIWSIGCIFYFMLFGTIPFCCTNGEQQTILRHKIITGQYVIPAGIKDVSDKAIQLIKKMLKVDPEARISSHDVLLRGWTLDNAVLSDIYDLVGIQDKENFSDNLKSD